MLQEADYYRPETIDAACDLLVEHPVAVVLSGGQSLGLLSKEGIITPEVIVDINGIDELRGIERDGDLLRIGALTTHRAVETSEVVADTVPVLAEAAEQIADVQIRNAGTIGGVCAYADPTADYPPVLMATDATIHTQSGDGMTEYTAREGFFVGYYESAIGRDEIVTRIDIPVQGTAGAGFEKLAYRKNDRAIVNTVAILEVDRGECVRSDIAVAGVWDTPVLAEEAAESLLGTDLDDDDLDEASRLTREEIAVSEDPLVSQEYRSAMVETFTKDALRTARERAQ